MADFLFGLGAGIFLTFLLLQFSTQKTINLAGFKDKAEDPKRYWTFMITYLGGALAMINFFLINKFL